MKKHLREFGNKMDGHGLGMAAAAALLVLCALLISPSGKAEIDRALAFTDAGGTQSALCWNNCNVVVFLWNFYANPNPVDHNNSTRLHWAANRGDYCLLWGPGTNSITERGPSDQLFVPPQGSWQTPPLTANATYRIKCYDVGSANSGQSGTYTLEVIVRPPPSPCTSAPNACGQTTTGLQPYGGVCDAVPPPNSQCPIDCTSAPNACGQTTTGQTLNGVCTAVTPPDSDCPASPCTSAPNACGMTTTGSQPFGGTCDAVTPPNSSCPACTSAPNICGMTAPGNILNGVCTAVTPPNSDCPACTSAPNACGMRNTGFIINGVCSATTPSNAQCPPPTIPPGGFDAEPDIIQGEKIITLTWSVQNATACTLSSDSPAFPARPVGTSGSTTTGAISQTTTFTLTCRNGEGGPTVSRSVRVVMTPDFQEI